MVTMRRRTLLLGLAGAGAGTAATATAACSAAETVTPATGTPTAAPGSPSATATRSAAPILASTTASTLTARNPSQKYVPATGTAPDRAYALGRRTVAYERDGRSLSTTLWYPTSGTAPASPAPVDNAAPLTGGSFPLVLFSHGLTSQPEDYAAMLTRWAQAGFVVAGPTYPNTWYGADPLDADDIVNQPADATYVIDRLVSGTDPVTAVIDGDRIAAGGHSAGGITTAGLFSAERDTRLKAGIVLNGTDFRGTPFTGPAAAMLFVHGVKDGTVTYRAGHAVYEAVPWSRAMLSITNGGHVTESADFEATTRTTTDFLRWSLYGDAAAKGRATTGDVATFEDEL